MLICRYVNLLCVDLLSYDLSSDLKPIHRLHRSVLTAPHYTTSSCSIFGVTYSPPSLCRQGRRTDSCPPPGHRGGRLGGETTSRSHLDEATGSVELWEDTSPASKPTTVKSRPVAAIHPGLSPGPGGRQRWNIVHAGYRWVLLFTERNLACS